MQLYQKETAYAISLSQFLPLLFPPFYRSGMQPPASGNWLSEVKSVLSVCGLISDDFIEFPSTSSIRTSNVSYDTTAASTVVWTRPTVISCFVLSDTNSVREKPVCLQSGFSLTEKHIVICSFFYIFKPAFNNAFGQCFRNPETENTVRRCNTGFPESGTGNEFSFSVCVRCDYYFIFPVFL